MRPSARQLLLAHATACAVDQEQVCSRRQLAAAGVPRWFIRNEIQQRRWQRTGTQTVCQHRGPLDRAAQEWVAVLEVGGRAALDGVSALQHAGLKGYDETVLHVSTPKSSTPAKPRGVKVHETRRFREDDVVTVGLRRMPPATAAIHAALWAVSDRQAQLLVTMTVQQRLTTVGQLRAVLDRVRRHRRRQLLRRLLAELEGGVQSLGELDVARAMRRRGLPEPARQSVRRRESGVEYLDAEFPSYRLVLEVDGAGHDAPEQRLKDVLRDLRLVAEGSSVLRIPLVAWRVDEEAVLDVLEQVFRARGWRRAA